MKCINGWGSCDALASAITSITTNMQPAEPSADGVQALAVLHPFRTLSKSSFAGCKHALLEQA